MKIAVYSGSFNPLHVGHMAIIRFLTEKAGFDQVYLVVTPQNPWKVRDDLLDDAQRHVEFVLCIGSFGGKNWR